MKDRNRAVALFFLLCFLSITVASTVMGYWYMNTRTMYIERVSEVVRIKKTYFESIYHNYNVSGIEDPLLATLDTMSETYDLESDGRYTCDFVIKSENKKLRLFARKGCTHVYSDIRDKSEMLKFAPVALALSGKSGYLIADDNNHMKMITAYDYLDLGDARFGIIAKIDYRAMLVPKINAMISVGMIAFVVIIIGGIGFYRFSNISMEKLKMANNELRIMADIIGSLDEYIAYVDTDLRYVATNDKYLDFFGVEQKSIKSHKLGEFLPQKDGEILRDGGKRCLQGENPNIKLWINRSANETFFADIKMTPHYDAENICGIVITVSDRTEEENAHLHLLATTSQLQKLTEELEMRVQSESAKRLANERIFFEQKKFADMGQMMNAIAHQWRQPINSVGLYVQLLYDSIKDGSLDDELLESFKTDTIHLVQHMSKTIDDFRSFFDPRTQETDFEVVKAIVETISLVEAQLKNNSISFNITCKCSFREFATCNSLEHPPCETPQTMVRGYSSEFKQVLMNLIQNSKDILIDKVGKKQIDIGIIADDKQVALTICDNGGGIPNHAFDKIFDPYFTTKPEGKGTGIGLYMSRLIIEEHMKGKIFASNNDEGAIFKIILKKVTG